jgi:hypothetical protein
VPRPCLAVVPALIAAVSNNLPTCDDSSNCKEMLLNALKCLGNMTAAPGVALASLAAVGPDRYG